MSAPGTEFSRARLIAYLLAELPAEELAQIDTRLLIEAQFAAQLEALRVDLVDEYALGGGGGERERWARALQLSGNSDPSLAFARALTRQVSGDRPPVRRSAPGGPPRRHWMSSRWAGAVAASLVLVIGVCGLWLVPHRAYGPSPHAARPAFTLLLRPQRTRGAALPIVHIPRDLSVLRVQIVVPRHAAMVNVVLKGPGGALRFEHLSARRFEEQSFVQFDVRTRLLPSGRYHVTVRSAQHDRLLGDYSRVLLRP